MAVGLAELPILHFVQGVRLGTVCAGIKKPGRRDLVLIELSKGSHCAAVFTRNAFCAAAVRIDEALPLSTGVIGEPLPVQVIAAGLRAAQRALSAEGWVDAAHGIMTTDTVAKGASRRVDINGHTVTVTGIVKGSGMIHPNMATKLAFNAHDAAVAAPLLQKCIAAAAANSFNAITVAGDTSTNAASG